LKNKTEQKFVEEALKQIEKDGLDALSLRKISRDMGLSNMAAYRHFKNKDDLLQKVAKETFYHFGAQLTQAVSESNADTVLENLAKAYFDFAMSNWNIYTVMFSRSFRNIVLNDSSYNGSPSYTALENAVKLLLPNNDHKTNRQYETLLWSTMSGFCLLEMESTHYDEKEAKRRLIEIIQHLKRCFVDK
jgi:AcrR family transcriptional regulator